MFLLKIPQCWNDEVFKICCLSDEGYSSNRGTSFISLLYMYAFATRVVRGVAFTCRVQCVKEIIKLIKYSSNQIKDYYYDLNTVLLKKS
jgi:hypothetical protein